jgi:hypothetical protein
MEGQTTYGSASVSNESRLNSRGFTNNSYFDVTEEKLHTYVNVSAAVNNYGYIRDSNGDGFTTWSRDAVDESKSLEKIFLDMYASQYKSPWQKISGSLYSKNILLSPIDVIKDFTANSNKKYYPVALEIDYYQNMYSGEFLELKDVSVDADLSAGFTVGFSKGFNS